MNVRDYYDNYWSSKGYRPLGHPTAGLTAVLQREFCEGRKCLDVGCGDGGTVGPIARQAGAHYVGTDVSETAVALARGNGYDAKVIESSDDLPFPDESFDIACVIAVLEHLFDPLGTLREVRRVYTTRSSRDHRAERFILAQAH